MLNQLAEVLVFIHCCLSPMLLSFNITVFDVLFDDFVTNWQTEIIVANHARKKINAFHNSAFGMRIMPAVHIIFIGVRFIFYRIIKDKYTVLSFALANSWFNILTLRRGFH